MFRGLQLASKRASSVRAANVRAISLITLKSHQCRQLSNTRNSMNSAAGEKNLTSISPEEREHFNQLASSWWNVHGPQRILHKMNILRMEFITETIRDNLDLNKDIVDPEEKIYIPGYNYQNILPNEVSKAISLEKNEKINELYNELTLDCLDIGCGGGILSESISRLPIVNKVKGIDLSPSVLEVAKKHKSLDPMIEDKIDYELTSIEELSKDSQFDIVTMFEMLEHVDYPSQVLKNALEHVKPGGYVFLSTINRDFISWFTTIFMGEHILRIVPVGTHTYSKYINQVEVSEWFQTDASDFEVISSKGCIYLPLKGWVFTDNSNVGNYFMAIRRKA